MDTQALLQSVSELTTRVSGAGEHLTLETDKAQLLPLCTQLKEKGFEQLIDLCAVDYSAWKQGVHGASTIPENTLQWDKSRYAVVYHLLSVSLNQRLRVRVYVAEEDMTMDSVCDLWDSANWYEREAFDLFGILFVGHEDMRRLLTDYGFVGHPLRKDFPLSGHVEVRYSEEHKRVIYEPVSIEPRVLGPRTIREN